MDSTRVANEKSTLESLQFAQDAMAVYHRLVGDKFKKYLQSGKEEDLGEFAGMSFATYLKFVDLFRTMSGKDVKVPRSVPVQVEVSAVAATPAPVEPESTPMTPARAAEILAQMVKQDKN